MNICSIASSKHRSEPLNTYDAADRLIRINYVGNATKKNEFGYDGLGRRITQVETPTTGAAVTTRNLWCGSRLCQERTSADVVTARYYPEGERRPVAVEAYVYMPDSLGSVRELVGAGSGILKFAYDYDAYGKPTRSWTNVSSADTKFRYAGLMYHAQSGLYLSTTRAYSPAIGRWLNRDTVEDHDYIYNFASPTMYIDPMGTDPIGKLIGGFVGQWGGRVGGAALGEMLFPAGGGIPGAVIGGKAGGRFGSYAGDKIGDAIILMMSQNCPPGSGGSGGGDEKPKRISNPKHHPNSSSPEPKNVDELYKTSVIDEQGRRWAKDSDGIIHRFSSPSNGEVHWNGSTGGNSPIRMSDIPQPIKNFWGMK